MIWLLSLDDLREPLASAVHEEAVLRGLLPGSSLQRFIPTMASQLVELGFRTLAQRVHPDRGGTDAAMRDAIAARDWLREVVGARR